MTPPSDGRSRPAMMFRSVLFPQPECPTTVTNVPGSISKAMSLKMHCMPLPVGSGKYLQCIFKDIAFDIEPGTFVTVVGHSGCGKSTLLNIIAGLERPSDGGVILDGKEIDAPGLDRMVVFQNFALMPWLSVYDNVRLAVKAAH